MVAVARPGSATLVLLQMHRTIWHKSGRAADIGPCAQIVADTLQKQEFYDEIRHLLETHKLRHPDEPKSMDVDLMGVDV